ncbi:hypothetical protein T458_06265 [Brevibacillus panacihumi W25]|uniref:Uracil-DNA glycosylase-like domain-containing protein n=1 Tax=Brevibacillus panacihumi W25 TaxID=1408254 RepID=V6MAW5_9BACL|nr:uracil-DNA glycosylase family protein [Brevibacillus panacihumi]EST55664.1 hypothetical protein T458_06265 [Brevibacillus panacihumi W25]
MIRILEEKRSFYEQLVEGDNRWVNKELAQQGIRILDGFVTGYELVKEFYERVYTKEGSRVVLCGINPGRLGAGKTGVPFLDFRSLSRIMPKVKNKDSERSAGFVFDVIERYGKESFFEDVYLTNISWFGFEKDGKNHNYYNLSTEIQEVLLGSFIKEMNHVQPVVIVPVSKMVERSLKDLKQKGLLLFPIGSRLRHPVNCAFPERREREIEHYIQTIRAYL